MGGAEAAQRPLTQAGVLARPSDSELNLTADAELPSLQKAEKLTTNTEKRLYLTSCWLETLCTAEARFLGWVYQELYGKPFTP